MSLEARVTALEEHQELCDRVLMRIDAKLELVLKEQKKQSLRLDAIDRRLDAMDGRLDAMDGRLDAMDGRFDAMDSRFDKMEKEFAAMKMQFEINQDLLMQIVNNLASQ